MKYLVVIILIGAGVYLFYSIRNGGLPDIEDVQDYLEEMHNKYGEKNDET